MKKIIVFALIAFAAIKIAAQPNVGWFGGKTCGSEYRYCPSIGLLSGNLTSICEPGCDGTGNIVGICTKLNKDAYCDQENRSCTCCPKGTNCCPKGITCSLVTD